jgi:hypothetical protein
MPFEHTPTKPRKYSLSRLYSGRLRTHKAQRAELIHIGYFDRAADGAGFAFWEGQDTHAQASIASGGRGQSAAIALTNIANSFTP